MVTIVSGAPGDTTYDMTAPELTFSMNGMSVDGESIELVLDVMLKNNAAQYHMVTSGGRDVSSTFEAEALDFSMSAVDPEGSGNFKMNGELQNLTGNSDITLPDGVDMNDMAAALKAGVKMALTFNYGGGTFGMDFVDNGESASATGEAEGGALTFAMSQDAMTYSTEGDAAKLSITSSSLPFPVDIALDQTAMELSMPLTASSESKPFTALVKLVGLSVSDGIWGMIDPGSQLPHDPATLIVDLSGEATLNTDLTDEAAMATLAGPPGTIEALDVNELQLTIAGAELTGNGGFTFDNNDMSLGYPKPLGAIDLALTGANALLDNVVAMGLVPEDQAMGARMMMGLFAVPNGDDSLTSKIEFREDGGLYANGQRLQ
jgi:hypothetical protein